MSHALSRRRFASALCGVPLLAAPASARATAPPGGRLTSQQRDTAERILRREIAGGVVPGIGYSIGNASETLAEGAFGLRTVVPAERMGVETRCALASVSKQLTAACVFLLCEQGALSLDAPLATYLPEYRHARRMTLGQVLTMSSGIPADTEACEAPVDGRMDSATLIENLNRMKLDFAPGQHYAYSNCAYDVAGAVVARVSGMSFARFVEERLFRPLGMASSYVLGSRDDPDFAQGYAHQETGWKPAPVSAADRTYASGNIASNPGDMQRWNRSLLNASLLSRASLREMFTVPVLASGASTHYASGWFVEPGGLIWHGGTLEGYGTANLFVPASGHAITLLGNTQSGGRWKPWEVAREIYNAASLGPALPEFLPRAGMAAAPQ